ncbi:MAG: hypothetical protein ACYTHM_11770 [Planctomycetota bacterium]
MAGDWGQCLLGQEGEGEGWGWGDDDKKEEPKEDPPEEPPGGWGEAPGEDVPLPPTEQPSRPSGPRKAAGITILAWFLGATPIAGEAGAGTEAPSWADAYGFGFGGGAGGEYRVAPAVGLRLSVDYQSHSGSTFNALGEDNQLSTFSFFGVAFGARFYFLIDRPVDNWFAASKKPIQGFAPFLGFDFGIGFNSAVSWDTPSPEWDYWDGGMIIITEFLGGVEYRFSQSFGAFLELGFPTTSAPAAASGSASPLNEAGSLTAFRFQIGVLVGF